MAVARFQLAPKYLKDLAQKARAAGEVRAAKQLERAIVSYGHRAELTPHELDVLLDGPLLKVQDDALRGAAESLRLAQVFETERDARVMPKLAEGRARLAALQH
jgi:hypothetical protein